MDFGIRFGFWAKCVCVHSRNNTSLGQIGINKNDNMNLLYNGGNRNDTNASSKSKSKSKSESNSESNSNAFGLGLGMSGAKNESQQTMTAEGNDMIVEGDEIGFEGDKNKYYSASYPTTPSTPEKEEKSVMSLFGGIGHNVTERQVRIVNEMKTLERLVDIEVITIQEFKKEMKRLYKELKRSNKRAKVLGVLPGGEGYHVWNLFGLGSWKW